MAISVSICIATYKRPCGLFKLLKGINDLQFDKVEQPVIEVVVVDNDSEATAKSVVDSQYDQFRWSLVYGVEPQQGVTYARNRSVALASESADFIVFIDDDEIPSPQWLDELLAAQAIYKVDVVTGPVYPQFESEEVSEWIIKGDFFAPADCKTGTFLDAAFTNNVLVKAGTIKKLDTPFDSRFAVKGAEDSHFFMKLKKMGSHIVWTSSAVVYESIPAHRATLPWLLERGFWGWSSYSLFEKEFFPSPKTQFFRFVKGIGLVVTGVVTSLPSLFLGRHRFYKSILYIYRGMGSLSGLIGYQGDW